MSESKQPEIVSEIRFLGTEQGGRQGPTEADWDGCPMQIGEAFHDCRLDLSEHGPISPGETIRLPITFVEPSLVHGRLWPGVAFTLWEGKTVAEGRVVSMRFIGIAEKRRSNPRQGG